MTTEAAQRARYTHLERREQEEGEEQARKEAQSDRANDLAFAQEVRAAEIEFERMEQERKGIDADSERIALAKERHDASVISRAENLSTVESDRADAITNAARQVAETLRDHADEITTANDTKSAEHRALIEVKVEAAARLHEYRNEREIEQVKIDAERRSAAALMTQQARETRLLREKEGVEQSAAPEADLKEVRALADLMNKPRLDAKEDAKAEIRSAKPSHISTDELVDEARRKIAGARKKVGQRTSPSRFRKVLGGLRRAA
jgi:hypothetical protein